MEHIVKHFLTITVPIIAKIEKANLFQFNSVQCFGCNYVELTISIWKRKDFWQMLVEWLNPKVKGSYYVYTSYPFGAFLLKKISINAEVKRIKSGWLLTLRLSQDDRKPFKQLISWEEISSYLSRST